MSRKWLFFLLKQYALVLKENKRVWGKIGNFTVNRDRIRVVTYIGKYSSGHLIPIIQSCQDELGIRKSASVRDHPCFLTF